MPTDTDTDTDTDLDRSPAAPPEEPALMDSHTTQALAHEMASVAGALFGLLHPHRIAELGLPRTPAAGLPATPVAPAEVSPAAASAPTRDRVAPPVVPAALPLPPGPPEMAPDAAPAPAPVPAPVPTPTGIPVSVPVPVPVPEVAPEPQAAADDPTPGRPPTARERRSMALLHEIAFLDE